MAVSGQAGKPQARIRGRPKMAYCSGVNRPALTRLPYDRGLCPGCGHERATYSSSKLGAGIMAPHETRLGILPLPDAPGQSAS